MGIKIIVGGQFGGEGKGKVSHFLASKHNIDIVVRVGGTNSGHTVIDRNNNKYILRELPTPAILQNSICVIAAGSYIDIDLLIKEIRITGLRKNNLIIDNNAMIITNSDIETEVNSSLRSEIGSTLSGTGACVQRRISREKDIKLAKDIPELKPFVKNTKEYLNQALLDDKDIIIEGTQGFGLSLLHSEYYPYTTSRDTTAAGFLSETGLSPLDVDEIILVIRSFPIRVEGNSGNLNQEITWNKIKKKPELSSVTKRIRRIGKFDPEIVKQAIIANKPTSIVLNHLDYIDLNKRKEFINYVENSINQKIDYIGIDNIHIKNVEIYK